MLLPIGNVLHKELSTSFVNFSEFIRDLRQSRFSGYIRLNFWQFITGTVALLRIIDKSRDKEGALDIHKLSDEVALVLASALGAEMQKMYELPNGNTMEKLLDTLEEKSFTGYLDMQFGGKAGFGTVYFLEGLAVESVLMSPLRLWPWSFAPPRKTARPPAPRPDGAASCRRTAMDPTPARFP